MRILLCGGGSGEKTIDANKKFNGIIDHNKPLLYVPLAMDEDKHPYDGCLEWITGELSNVDIPNIEMVRTFDELASKNYNDYCAIFIGGGNTYKLLKGIKDSGAFEKLREYITNNGIVYGGSAGAIIFGYDINSCLAMDSNDVNLEDTKGFNVLDGKSIFAHYTNEHTPEAHEKFKKYLSEYTSSREEVIALPEEDTIYINDENIELIGNKPYYRFANGVEKMQDVIRLIPYTDEDYQFVYEVKKNAYKKYVEECWGTWDEEAQRGFFDEFINSVKDNAYIIMYGDNKIGFYNGEVLDNGNYEVGNICIIPEFQGKGIGTKILKDKLEENKDRDIEIQYFKQNPVGKLYEKLGFVPNGEKQFHYLMIKSKRIHGYKFRKINPNEFDKLYDLFPDNDELWYKYREKRLKEFANHETDTYVIEYENNFIGEISVNYICHDLPTEAIPNQRVYLQAYRLDKKYRKQGIGQELVSFVLSDLESKGYTEFTIGVEEDNEIAKHIYFKFGFTEEIDHGKGDVFDPTDYTLYMRSVQKNNKLKK